jgi:hypothetical protein
MLTNSTSSILALLAACQNVELLKGASTKALSGIIEEAIEQAEQEDALINLTLLLSPIAHSTYRPYYEDDKLGRYAERLVATGLRENTNSHIWDFVRRCLTEKGEYQLQWIAHNNV